MIQQEFNGELSQVIRQMQHFVHQQLSQDRDRGQTIITVSFAQSLLKKVPIAEREQQKAQLELFLTGLSQVSAKWKLSHTHSSHTLTIETNMENSNKKGSLWERFAAKIETIFENETTGNFTESEPSVPPQSSAAKPNHSAHVEQPPIQSNSRFARIDRALNTLASELRSFVHLSNQRDDGKKIFSITRVTFRPKTAQANIELNAYLGIQKTSAHWSARAKSHFKQEEDKKNIVPYLTFSSVQFVNLGLIDPQEDEDYPSHDAQHIENMDYDISFESDEREFQTTPEPKPTTHNNAAMVTIEIRDKNYKNGIPRIELTDLEEFSVGRRGDIAVEVGSRHFCSAEHLLFNKRGDQWVVQDKSSNYSLHNGEKMAKAVDILVKNGDVFRLGAKVAENVTEKYDQFPEVKINLPVLKRHYPEPPEPTPVPERTPLNEEINNTRTDVADPIPNTFDRTELTDDFVPQALLYIALWIDNQWQSQQVKNLPAILGRKKTESTTPPVDIEIPAAYSKVSAKHLELVRFTENHVVITVCNNCTNGVFWYKKEDDTESARLEKGKEHEIPYECPIFLAAKHDPKSLKIQFVRQMP